MTKQVRHFGYFTAEPSGSGGDILRVLLAAIGVLSKNTNVATIANQAKARISLENHANSIGGNASADPSIMTPSIKLMSVGWWTTCLKRAKSDKGGDLPAVALAADRIVSQSGRGVNRLRLALMMVCALNVDSQATLPNTALIRAALDLVVFPPS